MSTTITEEDAMIAALTVWGEARGEEPRGMLAVAEVIKRRADLATWYGDGLAGVCLKKWQFSCWNRSDPNRRRIDRLRRDGAFADPRFQRCMLAVCQALSGAKTTRARTCTHYHTTAVAPRWARGKTPKVTIGSHAFYDDID